MDVKSRDVAVLEWESGVPILFGLVISVLLSLGLWLGVLWIGSIIPY